MNEMLTRIYALLVCFACMVCITISTGMGLYQMVKLMDPTLVASSYQYRTLSSPEAYSITRSAGSAVAVQVRSIDGLITQQPPNSADAESLTEEQWEERRVIALNTLIENARHDARASLIRIVIVLLISSVVFYLHWRIAQREQAQHG